MLQSFSQAVVTNKKDTFIYWSMYWKWRYSHKALMGGANCTVQTNDLSVPCLVSRVWVSEVLDADSSWKSKWVLGLGCEVTCTWGCGRAGNAVQTAWVQLLPFQISSKHPTCIYLCLPLVWPISLDTAMELWTWLCSIQLGIVQNITGMETGSSGYHSLESKTREHHFLSASHPRL